MRIQATADFEVTWPEPSMAQQPWIGDRMHMPHPLPHLAWETVGNFQRAVLAANTIFVNGFQFSQPPTMPGPPPEVQELGLAAWDTVYVPRIREQFERMKAIDFDALSIAELEGGLDGWVAESMESFRLTMVVVSSFLAPTFGFVAFVEEVLGPDGAVLAGTILQGTENASAGAGAALGELADQARQHPALAAALIAGKHDGLESLPSGTEFMGALRAYLDEYGWRAESWGTFHRPTWAEEPSVPLDLIGRYLANPAESPAAAMGRAAEGRERALAEVEARLPAEKREQFQALLASTRHHVPVSEERARWQLTSAGILRRPVMALGRKLAAAGALDAPDDIFYLEREVLREACARPGPQFAAQARAGRAEYAGWLALKPPQALGAMPDLSNLPREASLMARYFMGLRAPSAERASLSGYGASAGTVTGRARVIRYLDEADALEPGDVLVCVSTAPPWTPLFAIAAAIVTDTGGVMSHSAICAREFGIPCVVGTQAGTRLIPDGATIRVDGRTGSVEILEG